MAEIEECRRSSELDSEKKGGHVEIVPVLGLSRGCKGFDAAAEDATDRPVFSRITQVLADWGVETNGYADVMV